MHYFDASFMSLSGGQMKKSLLFPLLVAGVVVWGFGALEVRAGQIILPATLDKLTVNPANFAINAPLQFDQFTYTQTTGAPPPASGVTVNPFNLAGPPVETGVQFVGAFNAAAGTTQDWAITYRVTALSGATISDAYLSFTGGVFGGTGSISISETITTTGGAPLAAMEASIPGVFATTSSFAPQTAILVTKDISVIGGSNGATVSVINQGFSGVGITTHGGVPEPASVALLGIGISGLFALRRFFKRSSIA
jgi:hypothetical protein